MTASTSTHPTPSARPVLLAPVTEVVEQPRPRSASIALYAGGMVLGFLLAALASAPGGGAMVAWQLGLAATALVVCLVAARRARAQRRRDRLARPRVEATPEAAPALRRAA